MPQLPDATHILRCTYTGTQSAGKWANVFHVRYSGPTAGQTDIDSFATALRGAWDTNLKPLVTISVVLTNTTVVDLTTTSGLVGTNATSSTGTFSNTAALPAQVALVCSFKIARRYRGGHPRMYLPGQSGANTANSTSWAPAWITTASNGFTAWRAAINALTYPSLGTLDLVALSYYSGGVLRAAPWPDPISSCIVHTRIDTQRRRLGKELS